MAKIRIDLKEPFLDGMDIKFKAPCDCTAIDGMIVYYPLDDDSGTGSQSFVFKDAHGNNLAGLGNLFAKDAVVKVIVDRSTSSAYIQNAATNAYLEDKIANAGSKVTLSSSVSSTSTTTAANSYAVKQAYDAGQSALNQLDKIEFTSGTGTLSGNFSITESVCTYYVRAGICYGFLYISGSASAAHAGTTEYLISGFPAPKLEYSTFPVLHGTARLIRNGMEVCCGVFAWYIGNTLKIQAGTKTESGETVYDYLAFSYVVA